MYCAFLPSCATVALLLPLTSASLPFKFTPVFTANVTLGRPSAPIAIAGGILVNVPIINGTVRGPALNGTLHGGFAHPSLYDNATYQISVIDCYGTTGDGIPFYLHEEGVGFLDAQVRRISIDIGGGVKYKSLREGFILESATQDPDLTKSMVEAYLVENIM